MSEIESMNNCVDSYINEINDLQQQLEKAKKYNYDAGQQLIRMSQELQQLKTENEKLKSDLQEETKLGHKAMCDEADMAWEVTKLQRVLDEIEEVINKCQLSNCGSCKYYYTDCTSVDKTILNIIKQAKEGVE